MVREEERRGEEGAWPDGDCANLSAMELLAVFGEPNGNGDPPPYEFAGEMGVGGGTLGPFVESILKCEFLGNAAPELFLGEAASLSDEKSAAASQSSATSSSSSSDSEKSVLDVSLYSLRSGLEVGVGIDEDLEEGGAARERQARALSRSVGNRLACKLRVRMKEDDEPLVWRDIARAFFFTSDILNLESSVIC